MLRPKLGLYNPVSLPTSPCGVQGSGSLLGAWAMAVATRDQRPGHLHRQRLPLGDPGKIHPFQGGREAAGRVHGSLLLLAWAPQSADRRGGVSRPLRVTANPPHTRVLSPATLEATLQPSSPYPGMRVSLTQTTSILQTVSFLNPIKPGENSSSACDSLTQLRENGVFCTELRP